MAHLTHHTHLARPTTLTTKPLCQLLQAKYMKVTSIHDYLEMKEMKELRRKARKMRKAGLNNHSNSVKPMRAYSKRMRNILHIDCSLPDIMEQEKERQREQKLKLKQKVNQIIGKDYRNSRPKDRAKDRAKSWRQFLNLPVDTLILDHWTKRYLRLRNRHVRIMQIIDSAVANIDIKRCHCLRAIVIRNRDGLRALNIDFRSSDIYATVTVLSDIELEYVTCSAAELPNVMDRLLAKKESDVSIIDPLYIITVV